VKTIVIFSIVVSVVFIILISNFPEVEVVFDLEKAQILLDEDKGAKD